MSAFFCFRYQCHVEWAKSLMREQGFDDCTINKIILNYTEPLKLKEDTGQNSESQNEETSELECAENNPKLSTSGDKVSCMEGDPSCDPLAKCGGNESDQTDLKAVIETHPLKQCPFSLHDSCKQELPLLINKEYNYDYVLVQEEEQNLCLEEEAASEKSNVRLPVVRLWV